MPHRILVVLVLVVASSCGTLHAQEPADRELVEMIVGLLPDADKEVRGIAFDQIRTAAPGPAATKRFAAELPLLPAAAQIGLLRALADRGDAAAKPAVTKTLSSGADASVRAAAIRAIGKLGDATEIPTLTELLSSHPVAMREAARQALIELRGADVAPAITDIMAEVDVPTRVALVEILTARRALTAIPKLLELAVGTEASVRTAAMASLGELAGPEHVAGMTQGVLAAEQRAERSAAEKCLMFVCNRIPEVERRAEPLRDAMQTLDQSQRIAMLSTLGRIGGETALQEVNEAIASLQPDLHAAGIRAISNWPDASVAEELMKLAKSDEHEEHRKKARMALIRIAPLPDGRTDDEKLDLLKIAFEMADNDAERNHALTRAAAIRIIETLRFVTPYVIQGPHSEQACQTIVELAHHRKLRNRNKQEFHDALDLVLKTSKDPVVLERANRYLNGQTWVRPK
ncbi:HEAT repeat domain-containing protein [Pirellulales bacterium]|nr:HEAT repeat domain-containing protein [Pirellulales bacterium]